MAKAVPFIPTPNGVALSVVWSPQLGPRPLSNLIVNVIRVCEFQNRTTQNSGAQAGASPGERAYMTTGNQAS